MSKGKHRYVHCKKVSHRDNNAARNIRYLGIEDVSGRERPKEYCVDWNKKQAQRDENVATESTNRRKLRRRGASKRKLPASSSSSESLVAEEVHSNEPIDLQVIIVLFSFFSTLTKHFEIFIPRL